jgi:hypothetical protein
VVGGEKKEEAKKSKSKRRGRLSKKERKQVVPGVASPRPARSAYE